MAVLSEESVGAWLTRATMHDCLKLDGMGTEAGSDKPSKQQDD